jgi:hypothetical protein
MCHTEVYAPYFIIGKCYKLYSRDQHQNILVILEPIDHDRAEGGIY